MKKFWNLAFILLLLGGLLAGLLRTVFAPKELNTYENRYAAKIDRPSVSGYADGSFQSSLEAALNDQVPLAQTLKKIYNAASSRLELALLKPLMRPGRYFRLGDVSLFSGYLTYDTRDLAVEEPKLTARAENLNAIFAAHPDVSFYTYYIEKDTDVNFETGARIHADDFLFAQLELPQERMGKFEVADFSDFSSCFYKTDHHWKYTGSYRAYCALLPFLGCADEPLTPLETRTVGEFSGSKAAGTGVEGFSEPFEAYRFAFPAMEITRNGAPAEDYGAQDADFAALGIPLSYGAFYGGDDGEVVFDTHRPDRENLLILGESYDNAIDKLLASHFGRTYVVDLRYYESSLGKPFALDAYLREHNITKVLLIGNIDFYVSPDFVLED